MTFAELYETADADARCWLDERAAIREYDGGATRQDAEEAAAREYERVILTRIPAPAHNPRNSARNT